MSKQTTTDAPANDSPAESSNLLYRLAIRLAQFAGMYVVFTGLIFVSWKIGALFGTDLGGIVGLAIGVALLGRLVLRLSRNRDPLASALGPVLALLIVVLLFAVADSLMEDGGTFWTLRTLRTNAAQTSTVAVAALGMTLIIIAGGIDLSAGTALALSATALAWCLEREYGVTAAVATCVLVGAATGCVNGLLISSLRVVPFIVTLGTMQAYLGIAKLLAKETTVRPDLALVPAWSPALVAPSPELAWLAWPLLPNFAWGVWLALLLALLLAGVLQATVFGRHIFALGSNELTARLCGVNVPRTKIAVYTLAGVFVGIAGMYQFARLSVGSPTSGLGMELKIIAAVVIGGGSLNGGRGSVVGTLTGAAITVVISSGCTTLGLLNPVQDILIGVIIVAAVTLDQFRQGNLTFQKLLTLRD